MTGSRDGGADDRAPVTAGPMMAGRRGPVLTHGAMARADARGHGTGRHTGPWHGQTHGAMARPYAWGRWSGPTGTVTVDDRRLRHSPAREGGAPVRTGPR